MNAIIIPHPPVSTWATAAAFDAGARAAAAGRPRDAWGIEMPPAELAAWRAGWDGSRAMLEPDHRQTFGRGYRGEPDTLMPARSILLGLAIVAPFWACFLGWTWWLLR